MHACGSPEALTERQGERPSHERKVDIIGSGNEQWINGPHLR